MLKDKVTVVTGGGKGIGREICLLFAKNGSDIAAWDVDPDSAASVAEEVQKLGRKSISLKVDVTDPDSVDKALAETVEKMGRLDVFINNAGIVRDSYIVRMKPTDWDAVLNVNLKGTFLCTKAAAKHMMKQRTGRIVNIASIIGLIGNIGQANYSASKAGIIGLTKSAAKELGSREVTVNAIAPGFIQTDMTADLPEDIKQKMLAAIPLGKLGETRDVADTALFLASDAARYITGEVIRVDGGMAM